MVQAIEPAVEERPIPDLSRPDPDLAKPIRPITPPQSESVSGSASADASHPLDGKTTAEESPEPLNVGEAPTPPSAEVSPEPSQAKGPADDLVSAWLQFAPKKSILRAEARSWLNKGHAVAEETSIIRWLFTTSHITEESPNYKGEFAIRSFYDYCKHHPRIKNQWARYMEKKQAGEAHAAEKLAAREAAKPDYAGNALSIWQKHTTMPGEKQDFADILREIEGENFADDWHLEEVIVAILTSEIKLDVAISNSADFKQHFRILERPVVEQSNAAFAQGMKNEGSNDEEF
jgi:hypothetical protein